MFDHYISCDWAQTNMAIARMTRSSTKPQVIDVPSDLDELKVYLKSLRGTKILTIEETTTSQWLYVELRPLVDDMLICDPYRNKLLADGAKNDKIDAIKLVQLLKAGLLKPVFHSNDRLIDLRKLVSSYKDLVQRGVRLKNQRAGLLRAIGKSKDDPVKYDKYVSFVLQKIDRAIEEYQRDKTEYEAEFDKNIKMDKTLSNLKSIPGIGPIGAVKIGSIVVTASRFPHKHSFHSYCGLVRLDKMSGGRSYGSKAPRHNRDLKAVFKSAALNATQSRNCFTRYYNQLRDVKRLPDHNARHAVARIIAISALAVMRHGKPFDPLQIGAVRALEIGL